MEMRSALVVMAGVLGCSVLLTTPVLEATPAVYDPPEFQERLVVFELFNRSESGG